MTNENYTYSGWKMNGFAALFMILAMIVCCCIDRLVGQSRR